MNRKSMEAANLKVFLGEHPSLVVLSDDDNINHYVRCQLSGHEMTYTVSAVKQYVEGSKYKRLLAIKKMFDEHKGYLEDKGNKFFCKVTGKSIGKDAQAIERHIKGHRFQKNLAKLNTDGLSESEEEGQDEMSAMDTEMESSQSKKRGKKRALDDAPDMKRKRSL